MTSASHHVRWLAPSRGLTCLVLAGLLVTASPIRAEEASLGATIDGFITEARRLSPELAARALDAAAAESGALAAGALPDPMLKITSDEIDVPSGRRQNKMIYSVEQEIPLWGKRDLKAAAVRAEADLARADGRAAEATLIEQIHVAFARYWVADQSIYVLQSVHGVLGGVIEAARSRYANGRGAQADVFRASAALTRHETEIAHFTAQKRAAQGVLNALLLRDLQAPLADPASLRALPDEAALSYPALMARANTGNPTLAARTTQISAAEATRKLARQDWYPNLTLGAGFIDRGGFGPSGYTASVGVRVPLDWSLHRAEESRASAQLGAAQTRRAAAEQDIARALAEATATLAGDRDAGRLIRDQLIPQSDAAVRSATASYGNGRLDLTPVLDAVRDLGEARLSLLANQFDEQQQLAAIEQLIGGDL
ncbi:MAG: TolC family protein [Rhodospirillaceae bacterium]